MDSPQENTLPSSQKPPAAEDRQGLEKLFTPKGEKILFWSSLAVSIAIVAPSLFQLFKSHLLDHYMFAPFLTGMGLLCICSPLHGIFVEQNLKTYKIDWRKWPCRKGATMLLASMFLQWVLLSSQYWFSAHDLVALLNFCIFAGLSMPVLGALSSWSGNKILPTKSNTQSSKNLTTKIKRQSRDFLTQVFPFQSLYLGFVLAVLLFAFLPGGLGSTVGAWLLATLQDANISDYREGSILNLLAASAFSIAILNLTSALMVRISATYQQILKTIFENKSGEDILSLVHRSLNIRSIKIPVKAKHPHIRSVFETLFLLFDCYLILFSLVALIPTTEIAATKYPYFQPLFELAHAVENWVIGSMVDQNLSPWQLKSMKLFLGSYIAGCYLTPLAVTACAFLPPRKAENILASEQGLLITTSFERRLLFWSELKSVTVRNEGKQSETIVLKFNTKTVSIPTVELEPEKQAELLAFADELGNNCKMDESAVRLRVALAKNNTSSSLSETKKFESTIFVPHPPGAKVTNGSEEYRIIRKLLSKPLSAVYLVRQKEGSLAVLKQFVAPSLDPKIQKQRESFLQEYTLLKSLNHPDIATVIDSFEDGSSTYIALEHIDGIDLRQLIKRSGKRSETFVAKWALQICEQLKFMHEQEVPILHRDLTPDNLMLDRDGNVRIIDFGAAHQFMEGVTGTLIGKQSYIAPEQLRGKSSKASDIYSLGATLAFLLTGEDPRALQRTNLKELHSDISNKMAELVSRCTEFEESDRPSSLGEITSVLSELANQKASAKSPKDSNTTEKVHTETVVKTLSETINSEINQILDSRRSEADILPAEGNTKIDLTSDTANGEVRLKNDDSVIVELKQAEEVET